ncbi:hypothetical protein HD593_005702 [Nonomuraea rubra]|uniref:Uncharacterized protein n=1 Tax=Nonomuraea rubra TaxID=46180 RepID=A0A7X0U0M9_9ACTN|nr:hypothetical protein [Nonomuraea rubra]
MPDRCFDPLGEGHHLVVGTGAAAPAEQRDRVGLVDQPGRLSDLGLTWVSWKQEVPISALGMWAAAASTGAMLRCASYRPLIRCTWPGPLIRCTWPGPQLPAHTQSRPVIRASAPAANAPTSSCRTYVCCGGSRTGRRLRHACSAGQGRAPSARRRSAPGPRPPASAVETAPGTTPAPATSIRRTARYGPLKARREERPGRPAWCRSQRCEGRSEQCCDPGSPRRCRSWHPPAA